MPSGLTPRPPAAVGAVYIGRVEKVTGATAFVVIPDLGGPSYSYGPARYPDHLKPAAVTGSTDPDGPLNQDSPHTHAAGVAGRALTAGDPVLVALLANRAGTRDSVVILTRLA